MNSVRLQKLILSMLHDPYFRTRMLNESEWVEQTFNCRPTEIAHVLSFDERLQRADPMRADRLLTGLFDVYPVSVWSILTPHVFTNLRAFFQSEAFHRAIWDEGFVHHSFGAFLIERYPKAMQYVRLECAIEDTRHLRYGRRNDAGKYVLHHAVQILSIKLGYLETFAAARAAVQESDLGGAEFLLNMPEPINVPESTESNEFVLVEGGETPKIGGVSNGLGRLLTFLQAPRNYNELTQCLVAEGAEIDECDDLILSFLTNRWIDGQVFT